MTRPSTPAPTGTEMPAPVLRTFMPRCRPSAEPMRDRAHDAVAELLLDFEREALLDELAVRVLEDERVVDLRHRVAREFDVDDRADGLDDGAVSL